MPTFSFSAITVDNQRHSGTIDATDLATASRLLQARGDIVLDLGAQSATSLWSYLNREIQLSKPISQRELGVLFKEWATLVTAGIPIHDALQLSAAGIRRKALRSVVLKLEAGLRSGGSLRNALAAEGIPPDIVAVIGAGELSGELGPTLAQLASDLDMQRLFAEKMRSALIYPVFLTMAATMAIVMLLAVVVPNLKSVLETGNYSTLPLATRAVLAASDGIVGSWPYLVAGAILLPLLLIGAMRSRSGRRHFDALVLRSPIVGPIRLASEASAYCRTLSALVGGGVQLSAALPLAAATIKNSKLRLALEKAHKRVVEGQSLASSVEQECRFPGDAIVLMRTGERTGRLQATLSQAATILAQRTQHRLETITALATPILTVAFGLAAGLVVYAMLSTILSVNEMAFQ